MIFKAPANIRWQIFPAILVWLCCCDLHAETNKMKCASHGNGLAHTLRIVENDGEIKSFRYTVVSILDNGPPYPSCSIDGSLEDKQSSATTWKKTSSGYLVMLEDSANKDDRIAIKKTKTGYVFNFSGVSPMNCGQSSGIAERISFQFNSEKCEVGKIRN